MIITHVFLNSFLVGAVVWSAVAFGRRISLQARASSVSPRHFYELKDLAPEEQAVSLHKADRAAFSGWRLFLLPVARALVLSLAIRFSVNGPQTSVWQDLGIACAVAVVGETVVRWVEIELLHRALRKTMGAGVAGSGT